MNKEEKLISEISQLMELGVKEDDPMEMSKKLLQQYVNEKNLRILSDFDNYKKQVIKNKNIVKSNMKYEMLSDFIEFLDNWNNFGGEINKCDDNIKEGYNLLNKKINVFLNKNGLKEINTNIPFSEDYHECVSIRDDGKNKGAILNVISKGYSLNDKILKYPKVIVQK